MSVSSSIKGDNGKHLLGVDFRLMSDRLRPVVGGQLMGVINTYYQLTRIDVLGKKQVFHLPARSP